VNLFAPLQKITPIVDENRTPSTYFLNWLLQLTAKLNATLGAGFTGTIATAKLTGGGTEGSITFKNGVVVAQTAAT
jgi:hypothetical protein